MVRLLAILLALVAVAAACGPDDDTGAELGSDGSETESADETEAEGSEGDGDQEADDATSDDATDEEDESSEDGSVDEDADADTTTDGDGDSDESDDGSVPVDGPTVTVLDTGAEPRSELRIAVEAGDAAVMKLTQSQTIEQRFNGEAVPGAGGVTTAATTDITVESAEDGVYQVTSITSGSEVIEAPSPGAAAQAEAAMAELVGIGNRLTLDDRGRVLASEAIGLDGIDNAMAEQLLEGTTSDQIASPLPDEAVGVGARWEVVQRIPLAGLEIEQVSVYELVSIDGSVVELAVTGSQRVPAGSIMDAQGIPAEVVAWDLAITGTVIQDLTSLVPMSTVEVSGTQSFLADGLEIEQDLLTTSMLEPA